MRKIVFKTKIYEINSWKIARFPKEASDKLPSRGMVMVKCTINNLQFETTLEPDGLGSHWFRVSDSLSKEAKISVGDTISLEVESTNNWIEPEIPTDLKKELEENKIQKTWNSITTKSRWEWIRWIRFTKNPETRKKRIESACSMLKEGKKRPCCFNYSICTLTQVSKNGKLIELK